MSDRPWATGFNRLLAERRGLKKGPLAALAVDEQGKPMRPGTISAVVNSSKAPDVATLQRLANAFTAFDRTLDLNAPAVQLWEFFVSDEESALLRARAIKSRAQTDDEALLARAMQIAAESLKTARAERSAPPAPVIVEAPAKKRAAR